jgi:hypothetical protein
MTGKTVGVTSVVRRGMDDIKMREPNNANDEQTR